MIIPSYKPGYIFFETSSSAGVTLYETVNFNTVGSNSYTIPTVVAGISYIQVELLGGGGGGAKAKQVSSGRIPRASGGGGGGGGGYVKYAYTGSLAPGGFASGDVLNFTLGIGGTAGTSTTGFTGGSSLFVSHQRSSTTYTPATSIIAGGGGGGQQMVITTVPGTGGIGGTAGGGDINLFGYTAQSGGAMSPTSNGGSGGTAGSYSTTDALGYGFLPGLGGTADGFSVFPGGAGQSGAGGGGGAGDSGNLTYANGATGGRGAIRLMVYINT